MPVTVRLLIDGPVPKTNAPLPVSSVTAEARFAEDGVAKKVATPVPRPLTPVEIGNPVQLDRVPLDGVPKAGVTRVGDVANTTEPEPVTAVIEVPLILKTLPVPAVSNVLLVRVSVVALPTSVSVAAGIVIVPDAVALAATVVVPEVEPASVNPPDPIAGVVSDGLVAKTLTPVPVLSVNADARS